jgi:hypothetical protein
MTEKICKQYIKLKSDGLNFCMSSVCPEKDCIYALVNKLLQKIDCLEQENKKLKEENRYYKAELKLSCNELDKSNNWQIAERQEKNKYRSVLEEILESVKFAQCLPCGSGNLEDCLNCNDDTTNNGQFCMGKRIHEIKTKCVEVLNDK